MLIAITLLAASVPWVFSGITDFFTPMLGLPFTWKFENIDDQNMNQRLKQALKDVHHTAKSITPLQYWSKWMGVGSIYKAHYVNHKKKLCFIEWSDAITKQKPSPPKCMSEEEAIDSK